ncbi:ParA family protein (plasmid) [Euhalothece natronophila Z-M001]|uniref:ParA family protein n=1 Tax=Euhalothece natronophila Z-M001 TaxID=522448 RepID=A0A5B8NR94_9CHRO|nr:ParA family protein [Euhalothece natronophila]QDZ41712.1 ParA family protein [Euhalothece natronophila Z-M001]
MVRVIAIFNVKGGVGKSTTTYNLGIGLARNNHQRVLLIDIDPQGNTGASLGIHVWELELQIKDLLQRKASLEEVILKTEQGVDLIPSNITLAEAEIPISGLPGRELLLKRAIAPLLDHYDYILIDCPPNIGVFAINALMASEEILVPVDMSYLGLIGISAINRTLEMVTTALDHSLTITGVLATRYDRRNNLSKEVFNSLGEYFGDRLLKTIIPETVKLREAPSFGQSIFDYDPKGRGAKAYQALVDEVTNQ